MIVILLAATACQADTGAAPAVSDSKVPSEEVLKKEIEQAGDPAVEASQQIAINMIEHFHGREAVEAYRQELLTKKAAEVAATLKEQEKAEKAAKAAALVKADAEVKAMEAKIEKAEEAKAE